MIFLPDINACITPLRRRDSRLMPEQPPLAGKRLLGTQRQTLELELVGFKGSPQSGWSGLARVRHI